jgi:tetratricopeptide (TPR) repeat protein
MSRRRREDGFESFSYLEFLTRPLRTVWRKFARRLSDDRIRDKDSNSVAAWLLYPLRVFFAIAVFLVNSWAITRAGKPFVLGIPALLAVMGVAGATWLDYFRYPNRVAKTQSYYEKFLTDPKRGPEIAKHFALKQVSLQPDNKQAKFNLALVWEQLGESSRAEDLMQHLSEQDFVLAQVWFARRLLGKKFPNMTKDERDAKILKYLDKALELDPENNSARIAFADFHLLQAVEFPEDSAEYREQMERASEYLIAVSESDSGDIVWHLPKLMKILFELGQNDRAKVVYQTSKKMLMIFMKKFPSDERVPQIWYVLINSAIQLKDYRGATELIEEGKRESSSAHLNTMFNEMMSRMFVQRAADYKNLDNQEQFDQALDILCQGFMQSPMNSTISDQLIGLIVPTGANKKVYTDQLEKTKSINAPAVAHLLLGIHKVAKGDVLAAQTHWKIAETQNPSAQVILFSLVRSLVTAFGDEFENKKDVIALAIEQYPNQGLFYFLRGIHSMLSDQYREAIPDLKQAVQMTSEPANFEIQVQLAKCYLKLKDQSNADALLRNLQRIIQRSEPSRRDVLEDYLKQLDRL